MSDTFIPTLPGDGPRFMGAKISPRVDKLALLFLMVHDNNGKAVKHTKGEWLELAAEFSRLRAFEHARICTKRAE